jgi:3-phosphoshikimate 1-carboxyvinyltransferase
MFYQIFPSVLQGVLSPPSSKSHTLRSILFASLAEGTSCLTGLLDSPDAEAMKRACIGLGAEILEDNVSQLRIRGVAGRPQLARDVIHSGNSGQVLRFVSAVAALSSGYTVLTGDASVRTLRPIAPLMEGLRGLGAFCAANEDHPPLVIRGPIQPGYTTLDGADSQPVSALLIAASLLRGTSEIHVRNPGELPWVALTLKWLTCLGVAWENEAYSRLRVYGRGGFSSFTYTVPADFSSLLYPIVAAIVTGSSISLENVDCSDVQGDKEVLVWLQAMGAQLTVDVERRRIQVQPGSLLQGRDIDVNPCIDSLPLLAVVACFAEGKTRLYNAAIARKKESDRLSAITTELRKMGAQILETAEALYGARLESHCDHRIVMALSVAALGARGASQLEGCQWVQKSYPGFFADMQHLGAKMKLMSSC